MSWNWLANIWDWIRCHTYERYHLLDLRDHGEGHGYKRGWVDRNHAMLLACFALLRDYVEKEDPDVGFHEDSAYFSLGHFEYSENDRREIKRQIEVDREIRDLYEWWVHERTKEHHAVAALVADVDTLSDITEHPNFDEYVRRNQELDEKDDAQLLRLVKVREGLWT